MLRRVFASHSSSISSPRSRSSSSGSVMVTGFDVTSGVVVVVVVVTFGRGNEDGCLVVWLWW